MQLTLLRSSLIVAIGVMLAFAYASTAFAFDPTNNLTVSPESGTAPLTVKFSGKAGEGYSIDFGDGQTSGDIGCGHGACPGTGDEQTVNVSHTYTLNGTYTAKLHNHFARNEGNCQGVDCNVIGTALITVGNDSLTPAPAPFDFKVTRQSGMQVEVEVVFNHDSKDRSLTIDWGDGSVTTHDKNNSLWSSFTGLFRRQNSERYTHTYDESGAYTIRASRSSDAERSVTVFIGSKQGGQYITASPRGGSEPLTVQFETNYGDPEGVRPSHLDAPDMLLRFGDGSEDKWLECPNRNDTGGTCSSRPLKIDHVYENDGTYVAQVVRGGGMVDYGDVSEAQMEACGAEFEDATIAASEKQTLVVCTQEITIYACDLEPTFTARAANGCIADELEIRGWNNVGFSAPPANMVVLESIEIQVDSKNVVTRFFQGITNAFRNAFGTVISFLFPDRKGDVSDRNFAELPDTNQTERRSGSMKIGDLEAIIINTDGSSERCGDNAPNAFQAYVITVAPPEIGIDGCSNGGDISNYLVAIADSLTRYHSFEALTVQELLTLPIYLGNVVAQLDDILSDDDETPLTEINELELEVKAKDSNGNTVINWTDRNVSIKPTDELAFRWDASEYDRCLIFLADNGNYSLTRGGSDATMRTGNTETEGYNIFERTGTYRIECEDNTAAGHGISHGVVFVTVSENARGTDGTSYTISDVKSVTSKYVDPIPEAADDEYTEYTITLKNGTVHVVKSYGFSADPDKGFFESGFTGNVAALKALANVTPATSYSAADIKTATVRYVDPSEAIADEEYNEYIVTLTSGSIRKFTVGVFTNNYDGILLEELQDSGYTGTLAEFKAKVTALKNTPNTISVTPAEGVAPLNVTFTVNYLGSATLTFGDSTTSHQFNHCLDSPCTETVTHTYPTAGTYSPKLISGCPDTDQTASACTGTAQVVTKTVTVTQGVLNKTATASVGGSGGSAFNLNCPSGSTVSGIFGRSGWYVDSISLRCHPSGTTGNTGGGGGDYAYDFVCPADHEAIGLYGQAGRYVDKVGLVCKSSAGTITRTGQAGGTGGDTFELLCPSGYKANGIFGRSGGWMDRIGVNCEGVGPVSQSNVSTSGAGGESDTDSLGNPSNWSGWSGVGSAIKDFFSFGSADSSGGSGR